MDNVIFCAVKEKYKTIFTFLWNPLINIKKAYNIFWNIVKWDKKIEPSFKYNNSGDNVFIVHCVKYARIRVFSDPYFSV